MGRNFLNTVLSVGAVLAIWSFMRDGCFERTEDVGAIHAENAQHARERAAAIPADFVVPDSFPELLATLAEIRQLRETWQRQNIERFRAHVRHGQVIEMPDARHYILQSNTQDVVDAIEEFAAAL